MPKDVTVTNHTIALMLLLTGRTYIPEYEITFVIKTLLLKYLICCLLKSAQYLRVKVVRVTKKVNEKVANL